MEDELKKTDLTFQLKEIATWAWCLGLAIIAADFSSFTFLDRKISFSYFFFAVSFGLCLWAEKREFGTRVLLYRLHDGLIYSPWKYLLLYFLWTSILALFSSDPLASALAAANGWVSLLAIGLTASFLFCERGSFGDALLLARLRRAFVVFSLGSIVLMGSVVFHLLFPSVLPAMFVEKQVNLLLYFSMGLPFLLWDFLRDKPRLLRRWLSGGAILLGTGITVILGKLFFLIIFLFSFGCLFSFYLYKKIHLRNFIILSALGVFCLLAIGLSFEKILIQQEIPRLALLDLQDAVKEKMYGPAKDLIQFWLNNRIVGQGPGMMPMKGVWLRILVESGIVGLFLYTAFFLDLLWALFRVRRSSRLVVSNITFISVFVFLLLTSHFVENPYGANVWIWYAIWVMFSQTSRKREKAA